MKIYARLIFLLLVFCLPLMGGCIRFTPPPPPPTHTYLLEPDAAKLPEAEPKDPMLEKTGFVRIKPKNPALNELQLRRVTSVPPADGRAFVYRLSDKEYKTDPYNLFLVPPDVLFSNLLPPLLQAAGAAKRVFAPGIQHRGIPSIDITITQLYGDFSNPAEPAAVLELRVAIFGIHEPDFCDFLDQMTLRVPIEANTATALISGWERAMLEAVQLLMKNATSLQIRRKMISPFHGMLIAEDS